MSNLADIFRGLHDNTTPLRLANAWDAGSARLMESVGATAVATTSAGVAWALGYADGNQLPVRELATVTAAIARVIKVPLSVDFEGGYAEDPNQVGENIVPIIEAGAVGINIEDGTGTPEQLAAKIARIRQVVAGKGLDLFINARVDVYLKGLVPEPERIAEVLKRAAIYRDAGADGIFVPALIDSAGIRQVVEATPLPVNLIAWPGLPAAAELGTLGVRRLSAGSGICQALWGRGESLARAFLTEGESGPLGEGAMAYPAINGLFL